MLRQAGFVLDWKPARLNQHGYLAGSDKERSNMFNDAIQNPEVKALICTRGGFGAMRILDKIDYAAARNNPRLLIGFSDITALHLALYQQAGWRGITGPLVVSFGESSENTLKQLLMLIRGEKVPTSRLLPFRPGFACGPLLGGNLSMVVRLLGTPYLPSLTGALLVLEDINEPPYRIDAMLAQLRLAGAFENLGGLILGGFTGWEASHQHSVLTPKELFHEYFGSAPFPVATGLNYGHFPNRDALPIGVQAELSVHPQEATLTITESVVAFAGS